MALQDDIELNKQEKWEQEIFARHRWGRHGERAKEEHARLKKFWEAAQPLDESCKAILEQIISLEICNWNLEESIVALCAAIGAKKPTTLKIGHMASMTEERWKKVWAYYLTCRNWISYGVRSGYEALLKMCDPDMVVQNHVLEMLGEKSELKQLYVERLCLCLEFMAGGQFSNDLAPAMSHHAAVLAIEREIKKRDPEGGGLRGFLFDEKYNTYAGLSLCHHKLFRRIDIILSSIGEGAWRATMPMRGTTGFERAETLEKLLLPIEHWIKGEESAETKKDELSEKIHALLGETDNAKLFLASLLVSLLRSQQLYAKKLAESRMRQLWFDSN